jgi:hypothetical protein
MVSTSPVAPTHPCFVTGQPLARTDLQALAAQIARRIGRTLERHGLIERDLQNA